MAVAVFLAVAVLARLDDDQAPVVTTGRTSEGEGSPTTDPVESTTTTLGEESTTTTTVTDPAPRGGRPTVAVAVTSDGRLVVLDTDTGETVRVLATGSVGEYGPELGNVEVTPDGRTVYYVAFGDFTQEQRQSRIMRVPAAGGTPVEVSTGRAPAVSPDGRYLAFALDDQRPGPIFAAVIVRDLTDGTERMWRTEPDDEDWFQVNGSIDSISWSPAGDRLVYSFNYEGDETKVLDLAAHASLSESEYLRGPYGSGAWMADGRVAVVKTCCYPEFQEAQQVLAVDPATGRTELLFAPTMNVSSIGWDSQRHHLLLVEWARQGGPAGLFMVAPGASDVERLGTGFTSAAW